ncbi:adenosylmethionine--8-amino-7-oxononanoate transaminase [Conexibacter sp. SYSU D00693]|uniref:adenosylmethionine--8-amino-7-oxononanoate transaminase n=1 Tax=Conexibacter sp. SYSU D00693 TaxID=2812560 RepID=UPI001F11A9C5|nr:adenosylmethionine--8-amino-7-oxononanoate transaminase [Conexibacter sp. SYSU D00693]
MTTAPDWDALLAADREHVWHPYGPMPAATTQLPVVAAQGTRLRLADGRELLDAMSSWWCALHGHRHPAIDAAMHAQLDVLPHVMFGGLTHEPAIRLAQRLVDLTPPGLEHVFFADSGSVAVEVALKMALQAARATHGEGRTKVLTVRGGYHGDTFEAMAICDPVGGMHSLFTGALTVHRFGPTPPPGGLDSPLDDAWAAELDALAERHAGELAAIVVEPVVQGAGGMRFHSPACVRHLRALADHHGLLLVLDEIATGFGRTGALFACEHAGVAPDVLCVGKALTGGALTLAATLCTPAVARAISGGDGGALMHGPTFMANPLACAAGLASTGLLLDGAWRDDVARIEAGLREGLAGARGLDGVADVRVLGAIGVVQLDGPVDVPAATAAAVERGVWIRPFRDLVYVMPPYVTTDDELAQVTDAVTAAAAAGRVGCGA